MTSPHDDRPTPQPAGAGSGQPQYADRAYRSIAGICGGVMLLVVAGWLGGDAVVRGSGRTPWLTLAALLLAVPLIVAFTIRPAVHANAERIRIRNPFRTITLPWAAVDSLRASYSTELVSGGHKYQLWAIPVSLRARKRAARHDARLKAGIESGAAFGVPATARRRTPVPGADGTIRSGSDQALAELRELRDHAAPDAAQPHPAGTVRWAYEVIGPAAAGAIVLAVVLGIGG
jgi:hypothetical protein